MRWKRRSRNTKLQCNEGGKLLYDVFCIPSSRPGQIGEASFGHCTLHG